MDDIQRMLMAWGGGKAIDRPPNGFASQTPFARFMDQDCASRESITDGKMSEVDKIVSHMSKEKPQWCEVIKLAYIRGLPDAVAGRRMKRGRTWVRDTRREAEAFIEGCMTNLE